MSPILASRSPQRRQLLALLFDDFTIRPADIDETPRDCEDARDLTLRLAMQKARAVHAECNAPLAGVIGGDTEVVLDAEIFGKPRDRAHAEAMLAMLSGKTHWVFSAVALATGDYHGRLLSETAVTFRKLTARAIRDYCQSGAGLNKAGGYGVQGASGAFVADLRGSYSGALGLSLRDTQRLWHCRPPEATPAEPL